MLVQQYKKCKGQFDRFSRALYAHALTSEKLTFCALTVAGATLLSVGLTTNTLALDGNAGPFGNPGSIPGGGVVPRGSGSGGGDITYGLCKVLLLPEGAWGGLVTAVAGVIALVSAAMGAYKPAMSLLVVGIGAWLIRPFISLFFGDYCGGGGGGSLVRAPTT